MAGNASILNLSAFTPTELSALLGAAKAEVLTRLTGRVRQGSSAGQSYGFDLYTTDELNRLVNALTAALGLDTQETRVRPNFTMSGSEALTQGWPSTGMPNIP